MRIPTGRSPNAENRRAGLAAMLLLMAAIGGCRPEFQNAVVDAFETGVRGVVDAALDVIFTEARPN